MKNKYDLPTIFEVYALEQQRKKKARKNLLIVVAVIVGIYVIGAIVLIGSKQPDRSEQSERTHPFYTYDILREEGDGSTYKNFDILVKTGNLSEDSVKAIALELKTKLCKGRCNISLYSNQNSFLLEQKLQQAEQNLGNKLSSGAISKEQDKRSYSKYEKKYYVKIADGLVGSILIDSDDFIYYPYRDSRYKELGGLSEANISRPDNTTAIEPLPQNTKDINLSKEDQDSKARDAVAILDVYVKHNMNDPDSFEEVSYDYSYHQDYFIILLKFRGKNAFGGKVINYIKAKTDLEGNVIQVLENN